MPRADVPADQGAGGESATAPLSGRAKFVLGLGALMILLGVFIAIRPLIPPGKPITTSRLLDVAFAAFFIIRGWMNMRTALRTRGRR